MDPAPVKRYSRTRIVVDWIAGVTLVVLGLIGLVLPVLQGVVLIVAGLMVLSSHSRMARLLLERVKRVGRNIRDKVRERRGTGGKTDGPDQGSGGSS